MLQKLGGTAFLVVFGIVIITWIWTLADDISTAQAADGHCQAAAGERFTSIEDRASEPYVYHPLEAASIPASGDTAGYQACQFTVDPSEILQLYVDDKPVVVETAVVNAQDVLLVMDATWQSQPAFLSEETAPGRLIARATPLYGILAFAAVGGVALSYYFKRRRR